MKKQLLTFLLAALPLSGYEVLTISDAVIDYLVSVEEQFFQELPGRAGGTDFIDVSLFNHLLSLAKTPPVKQPGGSGANMVKGLAKLGHNCALIGYIGDDDEGNFFSASLIENGVKPLLERSLLPTGRIACFIGPDKARTMRSLRGAADEIAHHSLDPHQFKGIELFHLEGYKLLYPQLVRRALQLAKENGSLVSMDLASFEIAERQKALIFELLEKGHIDVLFCNAEEAAALLGLPPKEAASKLSQSCSIALVTMGKEGGWVASKGTLFSFHAYQAATIDETGAGDLFMSGFLHGFLTKKSLHECTHLGARIAAYVVEHIGAEIPKEQWSTILDSIKTPLSDCQLSLK